MGMALVMKHVAKKSGKAVFAIHYTVKGIYLAVHFSFKCHAGCKADRPISSKQLYTTFKKFLSIKQCVP